MTPYGDKGQHWFKKWLIGWQHHVITWANVDLSSKVICGIQPKRNFTRRAHDFNPLHVFGEYTFGWLFKPQFVEYFTALYSLTAQSIFCDFWARRHFLPEYISSTTPVISHGLNGTHSTLISKWNCDSLGAWHKASKLSILCNRDIALGFHYNFKTQYLYTLANFAKTPVCMIVIRYN